MLTLTVSFAVFDRKVKFIETVFGNSAFSPLRTPMIRAFRRHIKPEYVRILQTELPRNKELDLLNKGFVVRRGGEIFALRSQNPKGIVGSTVGGRFIEASWTPVTQAVAESAVSYDPDSPKGIIRVGSVPAAEIRRKTRFSWAMRDAKGRFRARGTTEPFGHQYIQTLEAGGQVSVPRFGRLLRDTRVIRGTALRQQGNRWIWRVTHRRGKRLHPEPGSFVGQVDKTVKPISMFKRALFLRSPAVMIDVKIGLIPYRTSTFLGFSRRVVS